MADGGSKYKLVCCRDCKCESKETLESKIPVIGTAATQSKNAVYELASGKITILPQAGLKCPPEVTVSLAIIVCCCGNMLVSAESITPGVEVELEESVVDKKEDTSTAVKVRTPSGEVQIPCKLCAVGSREKCTCGDEKIIAPTPTAESEIACKICGVCSKGKCTCDDQKISVQEPTKLKETLEVKPDMAPASHLLDMESVSRKSAAPEELEEESPSSELAGSSCNETEPTIEAPVEDASPAETPVAAESPAPPGTCEDVVSLGEKSPSLELAGTSYNETEPTIAAPVEDASPAETPVAAGSPVPPGTSEDVVSLGEKSPETEPTIEAPVEDSSPAETPVAAESPVPPVEIPPGPCEDVISPENFVEVPKIPAESETVALCPCCMRHWSSHTCTVQQEVKADTDPNQLAICDDKLAPPALEEPKITGETTSLLEGDRGEIKNIPKPGSKDEDLEQSPMTYGYKPLPKDEPVPAESVEPVEDIWTTFINSLCGIELEEDLATSPMTFGTRAPFFRDIPSSAKLETEASEETTEAKEEAVEKQPGAATGEVPCTFCTECTEEPCICEDEKLPEPGTSIGKEIPCTICTDCSTESCICEDKKVDEVETSKSTKSEREDLALVQREEVREIQISEAIRQFENASQTQIMAALSRMEDKCKTKDQIISGLLSELQLRLDKDQFKELLSNLIMGNLIPEPRDFDIEQLCEVLRRPEGYPTRPPPSLHPEPVSANVAKTVRDMQGKRAREEDSTCGHPIRPAIQATQDDVLATVKSKNN